VENVYLLIKFKSHVAQLLLDVTRNLLFRCGGKTVASFTAHTHTHTEARRQSDSFTANDSSETETDTETRLNLKIM